MGDDPGLAGIFATYPASWLSIQGGIGDQILGTMLLLLCICAATDEKNTVVPPSLAPMYVGFAVLGVGVSFGANCGYALNPARDLSPRLLTFIAGWGNQVFSYKNFTWFWIPIVGPHIGAILGSLSTGYALKLTGQLRKKEFLLVAYLVLKRTRTKRST